MGASVTRTLRVVLIAGAAAFASSTASAEKLTATFLYSLADDGGPVSVGWAPLNWDDQHQELYVVDRSAGLVRVFSETGMNLFSFGDDRTYGPPVAAAPLGSGDVVVLAVQKGSWSLARYSYRGEPLSKLPLTGVPAEALKGFAPDALAISRDELFVADRGEMRVLVLDASGAYRRSYDIAALVPATSGDPGGMRGFAVDRSGNILFTQSALFAAYVLSSDGTVRGFGSPGSVPGKFNVVGGIASDEEGRIYVSDVLRAVVSVFDRDLAFIGEFGHRGRHPGNLRSPQDLLVANNRVYVTQSIGGLKTFGVRFE